MTKTFRPFFSAPEAAADEDEPAVLDELGELDELDELGELDELHAASRTDSMMSDAAGNVACLSFIV
jgi:hypothetical protein